MKKLYIILTCDIHLIGGMQLYTAGKTDYLLKNNWHVNILCDGNPYREYQIKSFKNYDCVFFPSLSSDPFDLSISLRRKILKKITKYINIKGSYDEILIESQNDFTAIWGELLANEYNCRHICFNCNEQFRGKSKIYERYIDFFKYKYDKRELVGLHPDSIQKLFLNYYEINQDNSLVFDAIEPNVVKDFDSDFVYAIKKMDINISYIGRTNKGYVKSIIDAVYQLSSLYPNKRIQFIIVGDTRPIKKYLKSKFKNQNNIFLVMPGNLVPIPKRLFNKIDVVIAGAVCAEISAREGVPTIVVDCEDYLSNGVLGYTTDNSMYCTNRLNHENIIDTLIDVIFTKKYRNNTFNFSTENQVDDVYAEHLEFFNNIKFNNVNNNFIFNNLKRLCYTKRLFSNLKALFPKAYYLYEITQEKIRK